LLRFTNVYNPHQALGARTAAPRIENCRTGATMVVGLEPVKSQGKSTILKGCRVHRLTASTEQS